MISKKITNLSFLQTNSPMNAENPKNRIHKVFLKRHGVSHVIEVETCNLNIVKATIKIGIEKFNIFEIAKSWKAKNETILLDKMENQLKSMRCKYEVHTNGKSEIRKFCLLSSARRYINSLKYYTGIVELCYGGEEIEEITL